MLPVGYMVGKLKSNFSKTDMSEHVIENIKRYYLEMLPFNKILGIDIKDLDYDLGGAVTSFEMKADLIGNSVAGIEQLSPYPFKHLLKIS